MGEPPEERVFVLKNKLGLHARAANLIVQVASSFEATITVEKDGVEANAKSIMGLLLLAAPRGTKIVVRSRGKDAKKAIAALGRLINDKFGEK